MMQTDLPLGLTALLNTHPTEARVFSVHVQEDRSCPGPQCPPPGEHGVYTHKH